MAIEGRLSKGQANGLSNHRWISTKNGFPRMDFSNVYVFPLLLQSNLLSAAFSV